MANRSLCNVVGDLASSRGYKSVLLVKIAFCLLGFFIFSAFMIFKPKRLWHHSHASLLGKYHLFSAFLLNLGSLATFIFNLIRLSIPNTDHCTYLLHSNIEFWIVFMILYMFFLETASITLLAFERMISTARVANYEHVESRKSVILAMLITSVAIFCGLWIVMSNSSNQKRYHTGVGLVESVTSVYVLLGIIVALGVITVIVCQVVMILNIKYRLKYREGQSRNGGPSNRLSAVFQIEENLSMIRVLLPVSYFHLLIISSSVAGVVLYDMLDHSHTNFVFDTIVKEAMLISPLYSVVLPALLFWRYPAVFWRTLNVLSGHRIAKDANVPNVSVVPVAMQSDVYFAGLQSAFEKGTKRHK
ncbi:hypothetical protein QR680_004943 [Steinernema hermaphroditum]|uniref:Uncharacterized protein n=1 Tax=Steinernema hermaphroditum TaxID=289476 RepID=A0AA39HRE7_9BILA|nr:hypothetical protein QR680_004943 [Steinernema hermaphroditum]